MARRRFGALSLLLVAILLSGTLAACGSSSKRGLVIGAEQEPDCMDWLDACAASQWGSWTAQLQTEPMAFRSVVRNGSLVNEPGAVLAGAPTFVASPVETITYRINPAAVWSDGVAITCADFQYTVDQEQHGKNLLDTTGYLDIDKVTCPTPKTVVVTYKKGKSYASWDSLFSSTVGILPSHLLKGKDRDKEMKGGYTWSGGPWFAKWSKGDSIVLTRNPKYWGPQAKLDRVTFKFETDTAAEFEAFRSGQVDAIYPQPSVEVVDAVKSGLANAHTQYEAKTATVEALWFNVSRFPFDSKVVRQALGYAVDRDALVKKLFGQLGVTQASNSLNPFIVSAYSDPNAWAPYHLDLDKVTSLMTGAGWAKGSDGVWAKNGKRAAFTIVTTAGNKLRELTEQILQPVLKAAGFDMSIKNTTSDDLFGKVLPAGSYQVSLYGNGLTAVTPGLCVDFCTENIPGPANDNSGLNTGFVSIPAADVQMRITDTSLDDNARKAAAKKADDILADYNVALPLDPLPDILIWSDRVTGPISDNPIESMFWNLDQWELK